MVPSPSRSCDQWHGEKSTERVDGETASILHSTRFFGAASRAIGDHFLRGLIRRTPTLNEISHLPFKRKTKLQVVAIEHGKWLKH